MHPALLFAASLWHCFKLVAPWLILAFSPSVIVGLTKFSRRPARTLMRILNGMSVLVHSDSPGTFKLPFTMSVPPSEEPPRDATCGPLPRDMSIVLSMGPIACVMVVFAVLCAMAMNGCESSVRAMLVEPDITATAPTPLVHDRRTDHLSKGLWLVAANRWSEWSRTIIKRD
jgi:hypothetical protein